MAADAELDALKLRVSLLEEIVMRVWVSELATTAARTRSDAQQLALRQVGEFADAIRNREDPSAKGALTVFASHLESLKTLLQTLR